MTKKEVKTITKYECEHCMGFGKKISPTVHGMCDDCNGTGFSKDQVFHDLLVEITQPKTIKVINLKKINTDAWGSTDSIDKLVEGLSDVEMTEEKSKKIEELINNVIWDLEGCKEEAWGDDR